MTNELILVPITIALLLGTLAQLEELGNDASERTLEYANQAVSALDCAYEGRLITECAPGIMDPSFDTERERTLAILEDLRESQSVQESQP